LVVQLENFHFLTIILKSSYLSLLFTENDLVNPDDISIYPHECTSEAKGIQLNQQSVKGFEENTIDRFHNESKVESW